MKLIIKCGNWTFEAKQFFARKAANFGDEFTASLVINNSNGVAKVELFINKDDDKFTRQDHRDLQAFFTLMGFKEVTFDRFKSGEKIEVEKIV